MILFILAFVLIYIISVVYLFIRVYPDLKKEGISTEITFMIPILNTLTMVFSIGMDIIDWYYSPDRKNRKK